MTVTLRSVSELATQIRGVTYNKQDASDIALPGYLPVLRAGNIQENGLTFDDLVYVPASKVSDKQRLRKHDILIAASSGSIDVVGKAARALSDFDGGFGAFCKVLRPNAQVDPAFFSHYFKTTDYRRRVSFLAAGANINNLRNEDLDDLEIPLPPLAEQKRIAGILDAADALRAKRREALAQLDSLLQATFLDLFGEKAETFSIGDMLERDILLLHKDGNHGSLYPRAEEFGPVGIPFLSAKCISENGDLLRDEVQFLSESKARKLKLGWIESGDVLLAHNASVGKTFGYQGEFEEAVIGTSLTAFRANRKVLDPAYLLGALRSQDFQQQLFSNMGQTTRNQVPITAQRRLTLPLPPLPRQKRFASIVNSIEEQSRLPPEEIESRLFDLMALRLQLASVEHDTSGFEKDRKKVVEIAVSLEEKSAIPAVRAQLGYLQAMQETEFWVGIDLAGLEEMRLRLRDLVPLLDKSRRHLVFSGLGDEITGVKEDAIVEIPRMTGPEYERKVRQYLEAHLNNIVIHRLRTNQPLTASDLRELETMLVKIGDADGETLLKGMLAKENAPSLVHFVRKLVGMDRSAAQAAFSKLLSNQSLNPQQIRFVELIIEQLTARGVIEPGALYEAPFTGLHSGGPDGLFAGRSEMIAGIFQAIEATQPAVQSSAG